MQVQSKPVLISSHSHNAYRFKSMPFTYSPFKFIPFTVNISARWKQNSKIFLAVYQGLIGCSLLKKRDQ
jgi:hypothetical protein